MTFPWHCQIYKIPWQFWVFRIFLTARHSVLSLITADLMLRSFKCILLDYSHTKDDKRSTVLWPHLSDMANVPAVRRTDGAQGYSSGAQQHKAHTKDMLLQATWQFSGQRSSYSAGRQVADTSANLTASLSSSHTWKICRDIQRVRRSSSRQAAWKERAGHKRYWIRQQFGVRHINRYVLQDP